MIWDRSLIFDPDAFGYGQYNPQFENFIQEHVSRYKILFWTCLVYSKGAGDNGNISRTTYGIGFGLGKSRHTGLEVFSSRKLRESLEALLLRQVDYVSGMLCMRVIRYLSNVIPANCGQWTYDSVSIRNTYLFLYLIYTVYIIWTVWFDG